MSMLDTVFDITLGSLKDLARAEIVMGKPVEAGGKIIVPVLRLSIGFGGGGGKGEGEGAQKKSGRHQGGRGTGIGLGATGGVKLTPVALLVKEGSDVRVIRVPQIKRGLDKLMDKIPAFIEKLKQLEDA